MGGLSVGSLAGGVSQGLEQGQQMRARQMALQNEVRQRAAQESASNWLQSLAGQSDGPAPTAVPPQAGPAGPPMQGGQPASVPMPGATPMAGPQPVQAGPTAMAPPPPQAGPGGSAPVQPPQPGGPPGAPPPQAGPPGNPSVSGTAGPTGDVWADSKKTLQSVARGIAQANPGRKWKAGELLDAVNMAVKTMDGLNPMERIAAQAQIAGSKAQMDYWHRETQAQDEQRKERADAERTRKDDLTHEDRQAKISADLKRSKMSSDSREKIASLQSATRMQAAQLMQSGADDRLDKTLAFREQALDAGLDEKEWAESLKGELKAQGLSDAFVGRLFSAQSASGQTPTPPARPKVSGVLPAPPARGGRSPASVGKPIPPATMTQWGQVPAQNKAAAKKHLAEQGFDVSGLR